MTIKELIISEIKKKGKINTEEFINLCMYGENGYYIQKKPIGKKNDFITAPEISQMYGEILGLFIINYWKENISTKFNLVELGPGKGTLINDILRIAEIMKPFKDLMYLSLIEKNKHYIKSQMDNLNKIDLNKIFFSEEFKINNHLFPSIIFSNEFFDCFPIRQFYKKEKWYERFVKYNASTDFFNFISEEVKEKKILSKLQKFNDVKVAEISESRNLYFEKICKFIKKNKGVIITIDYGYKNPPNFFSLQTLYNHKKSHLFENIGNQDISSYVNFDEFINIAKFNGLKIEIYCTQKDFLSSLGIEERKNKLKINKTNKVCDKLDFEFKRLMDNSEMGNIFKVLVVSCL